MVIEDRHIIADDGKHLVRKSDGLELGKDYYLGYTYYISGLKLDEPIYEVAEDFEEIDD